MAIIRPPPAYDYTIKPLNRNLEAMARQLYDYWFVQFDFPDENGKPYRSSGGKMVWNEKLKREIPEGWGVEKVSNLAATYSGGTPTSTKQEYYSSPDIPWINSGELNEPFIAETTNFISELGLAESSAKLYPANSILVAMYGATAGKVSFLSFEASSNQAICGVIPKEEFLVEYIYFVLSSLCNHYVRISSGSARDNISQSIIRDTQLVFPAMSTIKLSHVIQKPIFSKIISNYIEISKLQKQRDELLPLLMNGQVSVMPTEVNCDLAISNRFSPYLRMLLLQYLIISLISSYEKPIKSSIQQTNSFLN